MQGAKSRSADNELAVPILSVLLETEPISRAVLFDAYVVA